MCACLWSSEHSLMLSSTGAPVDFYLHTYSWFHPFLWLPASIFACLLATSTNASCFFSFFLNNDRVIRNKGKPKKRRSITWGNTFWKAMECIIYLLRNIDVPLIWKCPISLWSHNIYHIAFLIINRDLLSHDFCSLQLLAQNSCQVHVIVACHMLKIFL